MISIIFKGFKHGEFKFIDVPEKEADEIIKYICNRMLKTK